MAITLGNNFQNFKAEFKKDTGLDASTNIQMYLQYYHARVADNTMQLLVYVKSDIQNLRSVTESGNQSNAQVLSNILEQLKIRK